MQKSATPSIDDYLLEEQFCEIFIPIRFETTEPYTFLQDVATTTERRTTTITR